MRKSRTTDLVRRVVVFYIFVSFPCFSQSLLSFPFLHLPSSHPLFLELFQARKAATTELYPRLNLCNSLISSNTNSQVISASAFNLLQYVVQVEVYMYMENIQPGTVNGYKGGGNNCGYFYLVCHQNSTTGTFLKVSCKMEAEILSVFFFHAHLYLSVL